MRLANVAKVAEDKARVDAGGYTTCEGLFAQDECNFGTLAPCVYPWTEPYTGLEDVAILAAQISMLAASEGRCTVEQSSTRDVEFGKPGDSKHAGKALSIFALTDLNHGTIVMVDRTPVSGIDNEKQRCFGYRGVFDELLYESEYCSARFCREHCRDEALQVYHNPICKDTAMRRFLELYSQPSSPKQIAWLAMLYRVLACAKNNRQLYPLRTPQIRQMTPQMFGDNTTPFNFSIDVKLMFEMLQHIGVDLYKDHNLDTWVLQTIQARLRNNVREYVDEYGQHHCVANLSYIFFNHNCEPNAWTAPDIRGSSTLRVITREAVKEGEEVCLSYSNDEQLKLNHRDRQILLKQWTGDRCHCTKCCWERESQKVYTSPSRQNLPV